MKYQPLTDDEKGLLQTIFSARLRLFASAYITLFAIGAFSCTRLITSGKAGRFGRLEGKDFRAPDYRDGDLSYHYRKKTRNFPVDPISFVLIESIIIGSGLLIFYKRIWCLQKDIKSGVKEMVPFTVTRKEYFPNTNQYFLGLDNPDYLFHEVDPETYSNFNPGDTVYLRKAIHSKYMFEENGKFEIM